MALFNIINKNGIVLDRVESDSKNKALAYSRQVDGMTAAFDAIETDYTDSPKPTNAEMLRAESIPLNEKANYLSLNPTYDPSTMDDPYRIGGNALPDLVNTVLFGTQKSVAEHGGSAEQMRNAGLFDASTIGLGPLGAKIGTQAAIKLSAKILKGALPLVGESAGNVAATYGYGKLTGQDPGVVDYGALGALPFISGGGRALVQPLRNRANKVAEWVLNPKTKAMTGANPFDVNTLMDNRKVLIPYTQRINISENVKNHFLNPTEAKIDALLSSGGKYENTVIDPDEWLKSAKSELRGDKSFWNSITPSERIALDDRLQQHYQTLMDSYSVTYPATYKREIVPSGRLEEENKKRQYLYNMQLGKMNAQNKKYASFAEEQNKLGKSYFNVAEQPNIPALEIPFESKTTMLTPSMIKGEIPISDIRSVRGNWQGKAEQSRKVGAPESNTYELNTAMGRAANQQIENVSPEIRDYVSSQAPFMRLIDVSEGSAALKGNRRQGPGMYDFLAGSIGGALGGPAGAVAGFASNRLTSSLKGARALADVSEIINNTYRMSDNFIKDKSYATIIRQTANNYIRDKIDMNKLESKQSTLTSETLRGK